MNLIKPLLGVALIFSATILCAQSRPSTAPARNPNLPTLWLIGDSTISTSGNGQLGWGHKFAQFFDTTRVNIENRARGGRSSRTFITEGLWDAVLADAKPGDFVIMQFGHNDGGPLDDTSRARGSIRGIGDESKEIENPIMKKHETVYTYGHYMRQYVDDCVAHKLTPIVCSPVPRVPRDKVTGPATAPTDYRLWSKEVAEDKHVLFIDLNAIILGHYQGMTPDEIHAKYFTPLDGTHTSPDGAELNAASVVEGLRTLKDCPVNQYITAAQPMGGK